MARMLAQIEAEEIAAAESNSVGDVLAALKSDQ